MNEDREDYSVFEHSMNEVHCGKCNNTIFAIEAGDREKMEEINNDLIDYYHIRFICVSCGDRHEVLLGTE